MRKPVRKEFRLRLARVRERLWIERRLNEYYHWLMVETASRRQTLEELLRMNDDVISVTWPAIEIHGTVFKQLRWLRMTKAEQEKTGLKGQDKTQGDLVDRGTLEMPEGLKRERKGPLNKSDGRKQESGPLSKTVR